MQCRVYDCARNARQFAHTVLRPSRSRQALPSREELIEVLMQTSQYAGIPAAVQALTAAAEVLGEGD